jgi:GDP-D-mannose dehydratase
MNGNLLQPEQETFVIHKLNEIEIHWYPNIAVKINPKFYRPAEVSLLMGNSAKITDELGWKPQISFEQLVERMVNNDLKEYNGKNTSS